MRFLLFTSGVKKKVISFTKHPITDTSLRDNIIFSFKLITIFETSTSETLLKFFWKRQF